MKNQVVMPGCLSINNLKNGLTNVIPSHINPMETTAQ
jgi:hypothetical protein